MSFKRDGDDFSQLNLLKKRRVAELLSSDIPDDEAFLMRNGRYACTVCGHRPVFDTVDMLAIHRQGKKHQKCLDLHYTRKRNFALELQKRKQEIAVRKQDLGGTFDNKVEAPLIQKTRMTVKKALLKSAPYDSRSKAHHSDAVDTTGREIIKLLVKTYMSHCTIYIFRNSSSDDNKGLFFQTMRQQHLQLSTATSSKSDLCDATEATPSSSLPGNTSSTFSRSELIQENDSAGEKEVPLKSYKSVKKLSFGNTGERQKVIQLQPYIPKSKRNSSNLHNTTTRKTVLTGPVLPAVPLHMNYKPTNAFWEQSHCDKKQPISGITPKTASSGRQESKSQSTLHHVHSGCIKQTTHDVLVLQKAKNSCTWGQNSTAQNVNADCKNVGSTGVKEILESDAKKNAALEQVHQALAGKKTGKPASVNVPMSAYSLIEAPGLTDSRRKELQHYLHLTSSGWKRDCGGNWVKDEDVEFDSDDEIPPGIL